MFIPLASGVEETLGTFKQNSDVLLTQVCSNCGYVNISYITYPNNTLITEFTNVNMTQSGVHYYLPFSSNYTTEFGRYVICGFGDPDGVISTWCYDFYINGTGREEPSGSVLVLFIALFLILCYGLVHVFIYSIGHFVKKDFDIVDLGFNLGLYFAVIGFYIMQNQYLGQPIMESILLTLIIVGAITHVFASFVFFFITMVKAGMERRNFEQGVNQ